MSPVFWCCAIVFSVLLVGLFVVRVLSHVALRFNVAVFEP